jgi:hypothetical protein
MPIKNYTTSKDVHITIGEIHGNLAKHGAKKIMFDYDDNGKIIALCFAIETPEGMKGIRLPSNAAAVYRVMEKQKLKPTLEQAERVAWRIVKDWVDAQMAILESEMVQMDEIFLPYMLNQNNMTLYQAYKNNQLAIGCQTEG